MKPIEVARTFGELAFPQAGQALAVQFHSA